MYRKAQLLAGAALMLSPAAAFAQDVTPPAQPGPAQAQQPAQAPAEQTLEYEDEDGQTIVVTGARSSVIGDIPPENVLTTRDILATGATDINELLEAIAPQVGSARGRGGERPVLLLNGQRISGFRELRDIPTEAIAKVEILPEEVALRYGYSADQKVVNFVLRPRFRSTAARLEGTAATGGGYLGGEADVTRLMIGEDSRTTVNLDVQANSPLTEDERLIVLQEPLAGPDERSARSLIGAREQYRGTVTHNRMLGTVSATGNVELQRTTGRSLIGLGDTLLLPLARNTTSDTAHAGGVLNGNIRGGWRWSVTGNADLAHSVTNTDRDATDIRDRAESTTRSADVDGLLNGKLFKLPAGEVGTTVKVGASTLDRDSQRSRNGVDSSSSLGRTIGAASVSVDVPVSRRGSGFDSLGNLTLNANGQVEHFSDFGTLTTVGAGANWSPAKRLNLIASWTREEGPPSIGQLGDPVLETPGTRIFDFTNGQTVLVTALSGGNPALDPDRRNVVKLGANWKPFTEKDLTLRGEYVRSRIDNPISSFPGPTPTLEAAFPERFVRNGAGELVSVDLRPVNYDSARRDTLRVGFDFSKPIKSAPPSQAAIAAFRARRDAQSGERRTADPAGGPPPDGAPRPEGGRPPGAGGGRGGGGGGGFGRFGGGRNGGRLQFSLTDTVTFVDRVTIRPGLDLDYLNGDALGQGGGRPRHQVEARAGYFNNGIGARLSANWQSGTQVTSATGDDLRFASLGTFDLSLFANLGQKYELVAKHPWLRGSSVRLEVKNVFDSKPNVRDASGNVPFSYQPNLLDPLGRTISISFRKLFLPPRSFFRGAGRGGGGGED